MSRDIKFRAWDKTTEMGKPGSMSYNQDFCFSQIRHPDGLIIMQYTGLKDKDGVEIYEGDIVEAVGQEVVKVTEDFRKMKSGIYNFVVFWSESFAGWEFRHSIGSIHTNVGLREYKVIGNIHRNPELLEAPND